MLQLVHNSKLKIVMNKHKSNKIKENSQYSEALDNGTDHNHSKSCCDQSSPARRTIKLTQGKKKQQTEWYTLAQGPNSM